MYRIAAAVVLLVAVGLGTVSFSQAKKMDKITSLATKAIADPWELEARWAFAELAEGKRDPLWMMLSIRACLKFAGLKLSDIGVTEQEITQLVLRGYLQVHKRYIPLVESGVSPETCFIQQQAEWARAQEILIAQGQTESQAFTATLESRIFYARYLVESLQKGGLLKFRLEAVTVIIQIVEGSGVDYGALGTTKDQLKEYVSIF